MREQAVAYEYAQAFFDLISQSKETQGLIEQVGEILSFFEKEERFYLIFKHPGISKKEKLEIIDEIAQKSRISPILLDFLRLLIFNKRINLLNLIYNELKKLEYERSEIQVVKLETPLRLNDKERESLISSLSKRLRRRIELKTKVNPSLLAGFKVTFDGTVIDTSFRGQLDKIRGSF